MSDYLPQFLAWLARASWQAAILTVVILAAQWVFQKKLSAQWRHALWLLVLARLVLPISPSSPMSIFNYAHFKGSKGVPQATATKVAPTAVPNPAPAAAVEFGPKPALPATTAAQTPSTPAPVVAAKTHWFRRENAMKIAALVWAIGLVFFAARIIGQSLWFLRRLGATPELTDSATRALFASCQAQLGVTARVRLSETTLLTSPALRGFLRPTLLLPAGLTSQFSPEELRHIFLHELAHVKRRDMAFLWLVTLCKILHWFNPALWFAFPRMAADQELACDELALSYAGEQESARYGETILKLLQLYATPATAPGLLGMLEEKDQMRRRISMIAKFKRPTRRSSLAAALLLAVGLVTLTDAQTEKPVTGAAGPIRPAPTNDPAGGGESPLLLTIKLRDGSQLVGQSLDNSLSFVSASLGEMKLPWASIRFIEYDGAKSNTARLTASNGDAFSIQIGSEPLRVSTAFGQTQIPAKIIQSIHVSPKSKLTALAAGAEPARLSIELRDGSHIVGKSLDDALNFHSPAMGELKLAWSGIRSIEYAGASADVARLTATNGDVYEVQFTAPALRVETSFGSNELPVKLIRSIQVSASASPGQMPPGLVALWSGEGDCNDSVNGVAGALCGNAAFADGKVGQAFSFDGLNSYVKIPQTPNLNPGAQLTIAFWMKAAADNPMTTYQGLVTSDFYCVEISSGPGGQMGVDVSLSADANSPLQSRGRSSSANYTDIASANGGGARVTPGQWHHIAATYDGTKLQLYVDGRPWGNPVAESGIIRPMLPGSFIAIGSEDGRTTDPGCIGSRYFKGLIDEVAIFNRALSGDEIQALCAGQNNGELMPATTSPMVPARREGPSWISRDSN